jgi:hypothetical protein
MQKASGILSKILPLNKPACQKVFENPVIYNHIYGKYDKHGYFVNRLSTKSYVKNGENVADEVSIAPILPDPLLLPGIFSLLDKCCQHTQNQLVFETI